MAFFYFLRERDSIWKTVPHFVWNAFGGMDFLFCRTEITTSAEKLPVKLSNFHQQTESDLQAQLLTYSPRHVRSQTE